MEKIAKSWLADPLMVKVIIAVSGLFVIRIIVALTTHYLGRATADPPSFLRRHPPGRFRI
jgi:hypothetical protein